MQEFQLDIIRFLQGFSNPLLDYLAQILTMLGEPVVLAAIFCMVYWCWDKEAGKGLLFALCASVCANGTMKDVVKAPRPIGEEGIVSLRVHTATGYSFPSGHTQSAAVFWAFMALWIRRRGMGVLAVAITACVGLTRMYLGVHYPVDVLGGALAGVLIAWGMQRLLRQGKFTAACVVCGMLAVAGLLWGEGEDTLKAVGMTGGMLLGLWLEKRYVHFRTSKTPLLCLVFRYGLGLAMLGAVYLLLKLALPPLPLWSALRYGLVVLFGVAGYPWLFTRLRKAGLLI